MSIRKERLKLIRERHRELILAPREKVRMHDLHDDWEGSYDESASTVSDKHFGDHELSEEEELDRFAFDDDFECDLAGEDDEDFE